MATAEQTTAKSAAAPAQPKAPKRHVGEWLWRFLAVVMLATVGWVLWIIYQINPQPLITNAAFEAAAKARAASQDAKGIISPAAAAGAAAPAAGGADAAAPAQAPKPAAAPPPEPKEPPVNVDRLRLTDTIETPITERGKKK